jgi:GNAT superfamily N-acetyltransferase
VLAAFINGQPAGMAGFYRSPEEKKKRLATKATYRGKGIGRALMEELRNSCAAPACNQIWNR